MKGRKFLSCLRGRTEARENPGAGQATSALRRHHFLNPENSLAHPHSAPRARVRLVLEYPPSVTLSQPLGSPDVRGRAAGHPAATAPVHFPSGPQLGPPPDLTPPPTHPSPSLHPPCSAAPLSHKKLTPHFAWVHVLKNQKRNSRARWTLTYTCTRVSSHWMLHDPLVAVSPAR